MDMAQLGRRSVAALEQQVRTTGYVSKPALPRLAAIAALILAFGIIPARGQSPQPASPIPEKLPKVNQDGWTSAAVCGECHQAIHAVWQHSLHANAWTNGVFQAGYRRSIEAYGPEVARGCLSCHAPTVRHGQDYDITEPITAEGITCDFCHSVRAVDLRDKTDPFRLTVGKIKYGPLRHAQSPAHEIVNSDLHTKSEFCAACHEYTNPNGVKVLGTYSEWKSSSFAKLGKQCQDCHMPLVPGSVVALSVKAQTPKMVNLHDVSGSHDLERVREAISLELAGHEWLGERVWVYVKVANKGSGHCFPTGLPTHRAVLEVTIRDGGKEVGRREIPFAAVMLDKKGRLLKREHEVLVKAARIRSDTRLKPDEERTIDLSFRDVKATQLVLTATLYYEYPTETLVVDDEGQRIEPVQMKFLIASRQKTIKRLGGR